MSDLVYIQHAYESRYVNKKATTTSRTGSYFNSKAIIGREVKDSKYGSYEAPKKTNKKYASKYYDPVARHERYLEEKASLGIGSGSSGGGGGGRSGGSGKSRKGRSGGSGRANFAKQIQKLREESSLNTDAQKEATKRKIEDMRAQLKAQIERLSKSKSKPESGLNSAEIRGNIQRIRKNIENAGGDLQSWIKNEKDSLEKKIGDLYKSKGISYKAQSTKDKENAAKARDKEVKSRADSIYKSKSKK